MGILVLQSSCGPGDVTGTQSCPAIPGWGLQPLHSSPGLCTFHMRNGKNLRVRLASSTLPSRNGTMETEGPGYHGNRAAGQSQVFPAGESSGSRSYRFSPTSVPLFLCAGVRDSGRWDMWKWGIREAVPQVLLSFPYAQGDPREISGCRSHRSAD